VRLVLFTTGGIIASQTGRDTGSVGERGECQRTPSRGERSIHFTRLISTVKSRGLSSTRPFLKSLTVWLSVTGRCHGSATESTVHPFAWNASKITNWLSAFCLYFRQSTPRYRSSRRARSQYGTVDCSFTDSIKATIALTVQARMSRLGE